MRRLKSGELIERRRGSSVSTANSGISPTIDRIFIGTWRAVGQVQHVVEEAVLLIPQARAVVAEMVHGVGDVEEVLPELAGDVFVGRVRRAPVPSRWPAGSGCTSPSSRCRRPARCSRRSGSGALRSNTPMLSSPRNPPWKTLRPSASLRFTHQVKLSISLWKTRSRKARSPLPLRFLLDLVNAPRGPGMHRRIDVAEGPLVGGQSARWDACTTRAASASADLWRIRNRPAPAACSGTPGPRRRTTDTPTCRAWR